MAKDWRNVDKLAMMRCNGASNVSEGERAEKDFYATDPKCMRDLLCVETFANKVWEPACGMGHLSGVLKEAGHDVRESDIVDRYGNEIKDFLFMPETESWDGDIVTNPPYSMAQEFVETALKVIAEGRKVAMFLKLTFLEGKKRKELFQIAPPNTCMSIQNGSDVLLMEISRLSRAVLCAMPGLYGRKDIMESLQ